MMTYDSAQSYDSTFFMNTFSRSQLCYEHFFLRFRLAIRCSQIATALRSIARLCARARVGSYLPETLTQQVEVGSLLLSSLTETRIDTRLEPEVHIIVSLLTMYYLILSYPNCVFFCYDKTFTIRYDTNNMEQHQICRISQKILHGVNDYDYD